MPVLLPERLGVHILLNTLRLRRPLVMHKNAAPVLSWQVGIVREVAPKKKGLINRPFKQEIDVSDRIT